MTKKIIYLLLYGMIFMSLSNCSSLRNGRKWGENVNYLPGWEKIGDAAYDAVTAPEVWIPLGGALIVYTTNTDNEISDWASEKAPIFGSQNNAGNFSDYFLLSSVALYSTTVILAPGGDDTNEWIYSKLKGLSVVFGAYYANAFSTDFIKNESARLRPDSSNRKSFPSGHTSKSAVHNMLALRNAETIPYFSEYKTQLHMGFSVMTAATAWARIEAKRHYPTDVLVGAALGNFVGAFMNDAFIGIKHSHDVDIHFSQDKNVIMVNLNFKF